ncbi:serine/threonine-protein kinase STY8-like isoform X1 [Olea europaea var. sylvestris]|uniref:serine/threonine-protein kinase STY8-like isoform X1 n=1 Tax=Olea europaea var. sylvestris TaxID=158386 RepID=UPI000C1D3E21|nr:serine/threonine-protein kinase STY8-like isoform X1 [Olea europaea var. sylvestris]
MDLVEEVGESSSPPRSYGSFGGGGDVIRNDVYNRLIENENEEALGNPDFREQLEAHFNRLPPSYGLDINMDRVEDVLLHQSLLARAKDPNNLPIFHVRFLELAFHCITGQNFCTGADDIDGEQVSSVPSASRPCDRIDNEDVPSLNHGKCAGDFEPCSKLEDLNLDVRRNSIDRNRETPTEIFLRRQEVPHIPIHEVIFSTIDKPKLLSQLSALLSDIGLNIREAHVFSTTDGYSLDVFVVDGWPVEGTEGLSEELRKSISRSEGTWSGSSHSQSAVEKAITSHAKCEDWEIDWRSLKIGEKIAAGSCGDLYRGVYLGQNVAVKMLRPEHLNDPLEDEFAKEVAILREVQHGNVVRFIGACTKLPHLCIVTEYMPRGSLYEYLHKNHAILKLSQLLKFAIDVCKGMEYLHQKNIIHRDLKTANLLMDAHSVVKVADFGVARFQNDGGVMTAETGTYRWMAPEVINHEPYDQKADVFSFAIVLWELLTAKVPYHTMTPIQAALGVRQGLRPELPKNGHPKLLDLMQRCWEALPDNRPTFTEIKVELEELLQEIQDTPVAPNGF